MKERFELHQKKNRQELDEYLANVLAERSAVIDTLRRAEEELKELNRIWARILWQIDRLKE